MPNQGSTNAQKFPRADDWFDIHQLYLDFLLPVGNGVRVRVGKFEFFKTLDPNASPFYTHPFEYSSGFPFTLTGISVTTPINKQVEVEGGISRGWNQTLTDNNSVIDVFGHLRWDTSESTRLNISAITGPEQFHDNVHFTTAVDVNFQYEVSEKLLLTLDATYGHQSGAILGNFPGQNFAGQGTPVGAANWYGLNSDGVYKINGFVSLNGRLEWYRDEEGYTLGVFDSAVKTQGQVREGANFYDVTIGLSVTPFHAMSLGDSFVVRPEVRYDYCSRDYFHNATRHDQCTFAIDAIFNF